MRNGKRGGSFQEDSKRGQKSGLYEQKEFEEDSFIWEDFKMSP